MATGSASRSSSWRQRATAVCRSRRSERRSSPSTKAVPSLSSPSGARQRDDAVPVREPQAAGVGDAVERLDAGQRAQAEEVEYRGGVERLAAGEAEPDGLRCGLLFVAPTQRRARRPRPQPARRVGERLADGVVALAHAGEAGGEGHVGDREMGRLEQHARRLAALRPRQGQRTGPHFGGDEAVQLAGAVAQTAGQALDPLPVDDAVADQAHGPADDIGPGVPLGRAGRGVGPAAQAGAEAGLFAAAAVA